MTHHDHEPPQRAHEHPQGDGCCAPAAPVRVNVNVSASAGPGWLHVPAMDCAAEESAIRRALERLPGVRSLSFRLGERRLRVDADAAVVDQAAALLGRIGFAATPVVAAGPVGGHADADDHTPGELHLGAWQLGLALALAIGAEVLDFLAPATRPWQILGFVLAGAAIALAGLEVYRKGLAALVRGHLNINALMSVAVTGAVLIGQWAEAAMVMALYAIAELIEARAVERARNAVGSLLALAPETATIRQADGSWQVRPVAEAKLDDVVRIAPGERVPLDGTITAGSSSIDQAPITGESIPVDKAPGDPVFAGTINAHGMLEVRVTALEGDSTLARIIHAVEQAQGSRAPTQRFVDRFAAIYTPAVFGFALLVAVSGPFLFEWTWMQSLYKALVLLVIACPCALVISTPVTIVSGLTAAARRGILVKGGVHLENARKLRAVALDKTGTITEGKPKLVEWSPVGGADRAHVAALAGALAGHSDHPVSRAIAQGLPASPLALAEFTALAGRGVTAMIDGQEFVLGNHRLMEERGQCDAALEAQLREHERAGRTVTLLASRAACSASSRSPTRSGRVAAQAVRELAALGVHAVMLTGDNATHRAHHRRAGRHRRRARRPAAHRQARHPQALAATARRHGDDRRRHQRRAGARAIRPRLRDGRGRHRHRDGVGRRRDHERRAAARARDDPVVAGDGRGAVAEHHARARHQGRVLRARGVRHRDDVDGGLRRHGREPAGGRQRPAAAAALEVAMTLVALNPQPNRARRRNNNTAASAGAMPSATNPTP